MEKEHTSAENNNSPTLKGILQSILEYIIGVLKLPFKILANFFTKEIIKAVKKDIKTYIFISILFFCMIIIGTVIWLFLALSVGIYFYEQGNTLLVSVGYSLIVQTAFLILIGMILYFTSKKLRSLELLKNILSLKEDIIK